MGTPNLRHGEMVRIRDERWSVARLLRYPEVSIIEVEGCDTGNRGMRGRFLLPYEPVERLPVATTPRAVTRRRWRRHARRMLAEAMPSPGGLRAVARADIELLPFQLEPVLALVRGRAARILVADEVGLGKTVQAGLLVAEALERDPRARALIVTPAALRQQWQAELAQKFGLFAAVLDASNVGHARPGAASGENPWALPLAITSIDYLKRPEVLRALEALVWDVLVIDEAHHVAGRSDRHAAVNAVARRARAVVMLSGTPHSGDDDGFARLCAIGDIDGQFPLAVFRRTRQRVRGQAARRRVWLRITLTAGEHALHRALAEYAEAVWRHARGGIHARAARLAMIVLAKRACSSAAAFARSAERRLSLLSSSGGVDEQLRLPFAAVADSDEEPWAELASPGLADVSGECRLLEALLGLARQVEESRDSKLRALARLLRRTREPAIVFTEYRDTLADVAAALERRSVVELHGGLTLQERETALRQFTSGHADVLLATDAAGEGLNLQHRCRLVVNLELPWTPVRLEQRVGRVDRIGQTRRVHQVYMVAAGTAEDSYIAAVVRGRRHRLERALEAMRADAPREQVRASEEDLAAAVFGGRSLPRAPIAMAGTLPPLPEGVIALSLGAEASEEAARAATSRVLAAALPHEMTTGRTIVTSSRHPVRALWAFRQEFSDGDGELLWTTLIGLSHRVALVSARPATVRLAAAMIVGAMARTLNRLERQLRAEYLTDSRPQLTVATARERALARDLERRRARLALELAQGSLFSRRPARDTAARQETLGRALLACHEHLVRLERRQTVFASMAPAFAIFLPE